MKMFKKVALATIVLSSISSSVFAGNLIIDGTQRKIVDTPHFYEFDLSQNPNEYWWCGHTAFKTALESQGVYKTLNEIHEDFKIANANLGTYYEYNCGGKWCASPKLMEKAITSYKNSGEYISYERKDVYSASTLFSTIKTEIAKGNTIVALSSKAYSYNGNNWYTVGHFMNIHGYYDGASQIVYVRDPIKEASGGWMSDKGFKLDDFYNNIKDGTHVVLGIISNN